MKILQSVILFSVSFVLIVPINITAQTNPENLLLKDFRPKSIYNIPVSTISKAKFPIIDVHSHPYANTQEEIDIWVKNMNEAGITKTILLTYAHGSEFD